MSQYQRVRVTCVCGKTHALSANAARLVIEASLAGVMHRVGSDGVEADCIMHAFELTEFTSQYDRRQLVYTDD